MVIKSGINNVVDIVDIREIITFQGRARMKYLPNSQADASYPLSI